MSAFQRLYNKVAKAVGNDPGKYMICDEREMVIDHEGKNYRITITACQVISLDMGDFPRGAPHYTGG